MKFSSILKQLRKENKLTQDNLAGILGIACSTVSMYERGEREPSLEMLDAIAKHFNVSIDYLLGKTDASDFPAPLSIPEKIIPKMKKVPLLGKTACGEPIYSPNFDDGYALISEDFNVDFALEAIGDSMTGAGINSGDIVYFVEQNMVDNGQIAAVFVDNEVTLKRVYYYRDKNKLVLQPENPKYEPLVYLNEELNQIHIIGKAVAHLRKL